ncbi:dUTP diphosphatase [Lysinibacillus sp. TE18511]
MNGQQAQALEKVANNMPLEIGFKRLSENAVLPTKNNPSDSGLDLYAAEYIVIAPGETAVVKTNLAIQLPPGYEAQVRPRSGITSKTKLRVQLGTIDETYRGDIGIIIDNISLGNGVNDECIKYVDGTTCDDTSYPPGSYLIRNRDKIAQLVVQPIPQTVAVEITEIGESERGENGFGSSGV